MMEARATVLRVAEGRAWVRVSERPGGCGRCDEPGGCRSAKLAYALKAPREVFSLPNLIGAQPGDAVRVRIAEGAALRAALVSYGLAALLLLVGAAGGHMLAGEGNPDLPALAGAGAGLLLAWAINRLLTRSRLWRGALGVEMLAADGAEGCTRHDGAAR